MRNIREFKRARTLDEARELLGPNAAYIAGGTRVVSGKARWIERVVDITGLGLDVIEDGRLGATARLQDVLESPMVPDMLRQAIAYHLPWTWRNAATVGGECVFGGAESDLLVALLALDGRLIVDGREVRLDQYAGGLVAEVRYRRPRSAAFVKLSRLKTEKATVNAAAALFDDGPILALGGVAARPLWTRGTDVPALDPPSDFRGSSSYRKQVAPILAARALRAAGVAV
ncbi:MAG: FAD binding domain-containing protein [Chloroflexota bacterium]